jgi:DNA repair protein RecN (Recombination protein N)
VLTYISVKNFAIIENIEVSFEPGMTALTGETGAGKSLLIDAIGLLLGDRASSNVVRTGENKAIVEGIFVIENKQVLTNLERLDIPYEDNEVAIYRQISQSGANVIKINGKVVTQRDLKDISTLLADIHTQNDTHRLINADRYLEIVDGFHVTKIQQLLQTYLMDRTKYQEEYKKWVDLKKKHNALEERLDLLKFQKKELESYNLSLSEEEELEQEIETMENFDNIYRNLQQARIQLDEVDVLGRIFESVKCLEEVESFKKEYKTIKERFENGYYELEDTYENLKEELGSLDFNPEQLDVYQERLNDLKTLKRKYKKNIPELIEYLTNITSDIENADHFDELVEQQKQIVIKAYDKALISANEIHKLRKKTAAIIEKKLLQILFDLELSKTSFKIDFLNRENQGPFSGGYLLDNGIDEIEFLVSTNVGEPLKPLSKTASGGEMSRIMLGLKNLLAESLHLDLIIFDEIDTGVSGYVAFQVAKKMKEIAHSTQVICITHIPQVAAISEHHLRISKDVLNGRTRAHIEHIKGEQRVQEIAEMISGEKVTNATLESARELLSK